MLSEEDLVNGCKQQNKAAQMALYKKYAGKMNAVCYRYVNSYDDAKDITQDGFIKVFSSIKTYRGEGSLEGWIKRIMTNASLDYLKKKKSKVFVSIESDHNIEAEQDDPEEEVLLENMSFTAEELSKVIAALPDLYRVVFNMHCIENYSHKEIGDLLSIKEDTSRTRLRSARKLLRKELNEMIAVRTNAGKITV